jgi:hypothetical protein
MTAEETVLGNTLSKLALNVCLDTRSVQPEQEGNDVLS